MIYYNARVHEVVCTIQGVLSMIGARHIQWEVTDKLTVYEVKLDLGHYKQVVTLSKEVLRDIDAVCWSSLKRSIALEVLRTLQHDSRPARDEEVTYHLTYGAK